MCLIWVFCVLILGSECNEEILFQILFMLTKPSFNPLASAWVHFFVYFWRTTRVPAETPVATLGGRTTNKKNLPHRVDSQDSSLHASQSNWWKQFISIVSGHAAAGRGAHDADAQREERDGVVAQVRLPRPGHHGLGHGQKPAQLGPQGHRLEPHHRKGQPLFEFFFFVFLVEFSVPIPLTICTIT